MQKLHDILKYHIITIVLLHYLCNKRICLDLNTI